MLLKITVEPVKLGDTQQKIFFSYMKKCRASEGTGVSGGGNFSTGKAFEQSLAWEANAAPLIAAGNGLTAPWLRLLFLLALPQHYLGSHP